jgi:hypothetical protein
MADQNSPLISTRTVVLVALFLLAAAVPPLLASAWFLHGESSVLVAQSADITVHGCIERDAASRTPIYKLAESPGSRLFRLTATKEIDVPSHVGHTVDVTGTVADSGGRQTREPELIVKKLSDVRDSCTSASAR